MRKISGALFFALVTISFSYGQVPFFQHYSLLKKNEPVRINKIFQDNTGFIWFGTDKGLFRFDGVNYQQFTTKQNLPDENVTAIAQDSIGRIWMGHQNGNISFLEKNIITRFNPPEGNSSQEISDILFDRKGNLWFSTLSDGLYYFSNSRLYRLDETDGMPDLFIYDIEEDGKGNIWAGSDKGVIVATLKNSKVSVKVFNHTSGLPDNIIKKISIGNNGEVWMATEDAGVIKFDHTQGTSTPLIANWMYGEVMDFLMASNQVWISTEKGLLVCDFLGKGEKFYDHKSTEGIPAINILAKDSESNIWAGSSEFAMRTPGNFLEYFDSNNGKRENIDAITVDQSGNIWYSGNGSLFKRSITSSKKILIENQLIKTPFEKFDVISLYTDSAGYIWAGLYGEGALRINPTTGEILHLNKELRDGNVLSITGKGNVIWLSTLGGATQIKTIGKRLDIRNYSKSDGLFSDYIYQVFVDSQNRVWFSLDGMGVDMMEENVFHHYQDGLNSKVVFGFAEDNNHNIWVNVQGDGLYQFDGTKFIRPNFGNFHLLDNNINCLSTDNSGDLVVMHDFGIDIYDVTKNKVFFIGANAGINNRKPNLNAVSKDYLGNIYFGTSDGIIKYSKPLNWSPALPKPFIEEMRVADKVADMTSLMNLQHNQNNVTINYGGFWYQNPESLHFRYKLENFDKEWITSFNRSTVYSDLSAGHYIFKLMVSDSEDFREAQEIALEFNVAPAFWRTGWFQFSCALTLLVLLFSIVKFRERSLRNEKRILEAKVEQRTLEIRIKNEEIRAQAEKIKNINEGLEILVQERTIQLERKNKALEEYAFITAHNLRAPVASILGLTSLISKIKLDDDEKIILEHLQSSTEKLDSIVRSITEAIEKAG